MRTRKTIVILISGKAGAGKTTLAEILKEKLSEIEGINISRYSFANPIKYIAQAFGTWDKEKDDRGRKLLQDIGRVFREYNENIWAVHMINQMDKKSVFPENFWIVDDWRFPNEQAYLANNPLIEVFPIRVTGRQYELGELANDASETSLSEDGNYAYIDNSGSIDELTTKAIELVEDLKTLYIVE